MKFGKTLLKAQRPEWSRNYIAYKQLKQLIKRIRPSVVSEPSATTPPAGEQNDGGDDSDGIAAFFFQLDRELERVNAFFLYKKAEQERRVRILVEKFRAIQLINNEMLLLSSSSDSDNSDAAIMGDPVADSQLLTSLMDTKERIHRILQFADINVEGFRKILKKFDKCLGRSDIDVYFRTKVRVMPFADAQVLNGALDLLEETIAVMQARVDLAVAVYPPDTAEAAKAAALQQRRRPRPDGFSEDDLDRLQTLTQADDVNGLREFGKLHAIPLVDRSAPPFDAAVTVTSNRALARRLQTALAEACRHSAFKCLTLLLDSGADVGGTDDVNERGLLHKLVLALGDKSSAGHDNPEVVDFLLQHRRVAATLTACDIYGRIPLHYAAILGCPRIAAVLATHQRLVDPAITRGRICGAVHLDHEGHSAIFYAVLNGHCAVVETLVASVGGVDVDNLCMLDLETPVAMVKPTSASPHPSWLGRASALAHTPLALACKFGHADIVDLLLSHGANVDHADDQGETPLHWAAKNGFVACVRLLVTKSRPSEKKPNLEALETVSGWSPLFSAAVEGHLECVKELLDAGSDADRVDASGWTAHEHAIFRGHVQIGAVLKPRMKRWVERLASASDSPISPGSPTKSAAFTAGAGAARSYGHNYLQDQFMLIVHIGANDTRRQSLATAALFDGVAPGHPSLSMTVSVLNATGEPAVVDLPLREDQQHQPEPIIFHSHKNDKALDGVLLRFDIQPTYGSKKLLLGRATVVVADAIKSALSNYNVHGQHSGGINSAWVNAPVIGTNLDTIGTITFELTVVSPFSHPNLSIGSKQTYWKSVATKVIGHRGAGANKRFTGGGNLQIGENTVLSLVTAASLGAEYVEFDVQLTKDDVPVIYHDWKLSETGLSIPVNSVTLEEFQRLGPQARPRRSKDDFLNKSSSGRKTAVVTDVAAAASGQSAWQLDDMSLTTNGGRHVRGFSSSYAMSQNTDEASKPHHGGRADHAIKAPFATLEETLRRVPQHIGFNIEVKYPSAMETEANSLNFTELNRFVDQILQCVYDHAGSRSILFSSFHPEACLMLNLKQPNYPVFFLTDSGVELTYDPRCNSLQAAIRFAKFADLLGLVTVSDPLVDAPQLCKTVKQSGLLLFTYGHHNNDVEMVKLQRQFGVDAVIVDKILPIVDGLTASTSTASNANVLAV